MEHDNVVTTGAVVGDNVVTTGAVVGDNVVTTAAVTVASSNTMTCSPPLIPHWTVDALAGITNVAERVFHWPVGSEPTTMLMSGAAEVPVDV